jgi:hypothetical protein
VGHWSITEIANTLFGYRKSGVLLTLKANFDGSGKNDSTVLTVGGIVAWDDVCQTTERLWSDALLAAGYCDEQGNAGIFHLAEFGTEHCEYGTGEWNIQNKQIPFTKNLARIVNRVGDIVMSFSVETAQIQEFLDRCAHPEIYGPEMFSAAAMLLFSYIEDTLDKFVTPTKVGYVFESGDRQHELNHAFQEYIKYHPQLRPLRSLGFVPKGVPMLQAADLVAGKINEVLTYATQSIKTLDNGFLLTPVSHFERFYEGTSAELMKEGAGFGKHDCFVLNKAALLNADRRIGQAIANNPQILASRNRQFRKPRNGK